jgi:hypothetical protein
MEDLALRSGESSLVAGGRPACLLNLATRSSLVLCGRASRAEQTSKLARADNWLTCYPRLS